MKTFIRRFRSLLPSSLRKFSHRITGFLVADLAPPFPSIERSLALLKQAGFHPRFCIDLGAYTGEWATMFRGIFPDSRVLMLEAQESKRQILEGIVERSGGMISLELCLVGPVDGQEVDFVEMETGSSVFEEESDFPRQRIKKIVRTLDNLVEQNGYPAPDLIKLDIQGFELEALKGAPRILRQAQAVLMETSLVPINQGCPLFATVIDFMNKEGYRLFDFCSQIRRDDGVLWQTDLLFLRNDSPLIPQASLKAPQ